jgi:Clp amino terminal domain, pathogenicity island component
MPTEPVPPETLHGWAICLRASEEARRRGDRRAGTDHVLLALFEDPSTEGLLGVSLQQARQAMESLDREALGALGLGPGADAPELPMHAVPKKPTLRYLMLQKDRLRMTPAAKKVLEDASKPNRRRLYVTARQVLARILTLQPPDPAAVLLDALGVNTSEVRRRLDLPSEARQETHGDAAVPSKGRSRG